MLLRTLATGVCHSDLHLWDGFYDIGGGKRLSLRDRGLVPPITLGHEIAGEVVAFGPEAQGAKPGDRRVIFPWIGCGTCATCRRGDEHLCNRPRSLGIQRPGGFADHVWCRIRAICSPSAARARRRRRPMPVPASPPLPRCGRVGEAVYRTQPVLVIGAGGLGLMAVALLQALGGHGAVVADIDPKKREAALAGGRASARSMPAPPMR